MITAVATTLLALGLDLIFKYAQVKDNDKDATKMAISVMDIIKIFTGKMDHYAKFDPVTETQSKPSGN